MVKIDHSVSNDHLDTQGYGIRTVAHRKSRSPRPPGVYPCSLRSVFDPFLASLDGEVVKSGLCQGDGAMSVKVL